MFLLAMTKSGVSDKFGSNKFEEFSIPKGKLTIVFDNFLSRVLSEDDGLSVIESPLIYCGNPKELVFSVARYRKETDILEVSKPLVSGRSIYYHLDSEGNFYCSTHIAMLRQAGIIIRENMTALPEFFVFRFTMAPQTLYEGIWQLNVGGRLRVKWCDGKCELEVTDKFDPPNGGKDPGLFKDFRKKTSVLLANSIEPLGVCKNRFGLLLSGGLDSSLLLTVFRALNFDVDVTYSTGYPFEDFEKEYALSAAKFFGISHEYHEITMPEYLRGLIEANSIAEQPLPHMQSVLFYLLLRDGLPKNKGIVSNGQGAELSCNRVGFETYQFGKQMSKLWLLRQMGKLPVVSRWSIRAIKWAVAYQSKIDCPIKDPNNVIWSSEAVGSLDWASEYFHISQGDIINNPLSVLRPYRDRPIYDVVTIYDLLNQNDNTMSVWSKIGESQHKIVHFPFNDSALVSYFFSIPVDIKFKEYKHVLKEVARDCGVPSFIIDRRKLGFNPLTNLNLLKKEVFEPLFPVASKVFDEREIHRVEPSDYGLGFWTLWNILNYSVWKRLWINNEPAEVLLEELTAA